VYKQRGQWLEGNIKRKIKLGGGNIYKEITWGIHDCAYQGFKTVGSGHFAYYGKKAMET
jgi:hypothetical protein